MRSTLTACIHGVQYWIMLCYFTKIKLHPPTNPLKNVYLDFDKNRNPNPKLDPETSVREKNMILNVGTTSMIESIVDSKYEL